ncbi:hypothetical protein [Flavihumibacter sp. CACIAM 22H1]|uniref:hypothetical protein n=1 Tax=Flavihumibacter sp. CACIAM 22H1 TaxID=1812911 RepID=UPI0007A87B37|nr:hypothetical protein [Flavihumibacter sp. CACIAM 22H1]KYP15338.1 MAG: hypothetical protein A1D16_15675 [Flavihumibacter sp. CACIAM 22H1]
MKSYRGAIGVSLAISLYIYVIYRTDKTLVNQLIIALVSWEKYAALKAEIRALFPLADWIIYSLPEGLWIFCITLSSHYFFLEIKGSRLNLSLLPILLAVTMELFQLVHLSNGRFDWMDLLISFTFWLFALFVTRMNLEKQALFRTWNQASYTCIFSYAIVYLAHVIR